jgi:hypothetical protein
MSATLPAAAPGPEAARRNAEARGEIAPTAQVPTEAAAPGQNLAVTLEWSFNPWRQDLRRALVGTIAAAAATTLIAGLGLPPLAFAGLAIAFLATVHSAFLPTRCRMDDEGVARRLAFAWERRPWAMIRRATLGPRGLFVSPRLHPGPLESFRGLWLPIPPGAAPTLLSDLRGHLARHGLSS